MSDTLKPCPFCAYDKARIEKWEVGEGRGKHVEYAVVCENCGCFGPNDLGWSGAVEMWNMRRKEFPAPYNVGDGNV
jgi:hypothetical protein